VIEGTLVAVSAWIARIWWRAAGHAPAAGSRHRAATNAPASSGRRWRRRLGTPVQAGAPGPEQVGPQCRRCCRKPAVAGWIGRSKRTPCLAFEAPGCASPLRLEANLLASAGSGDTRRQLGSEPAVSDHRSSGCAGCGSSNPRWPAAWSGVRLVQYAAKEGGTNRALIEAPPAPALRPWGPVIVNDRIESGPGWRPMVHLARGLPGHARRLCSADR